MLIRFALTPRSSIFGFDGSPATNSSKASSATAAIENLPVNGREYINFTLKGSQVPSVHPSSTGSAPRLGSNTVGQRSASTVVHVDEAEAVDNSVNGVQSVESAVAAAGSAPAASGRTQAPEVASDETAKELFRLGTVQAPPYTFSGFASASGRALSVDPGALSGKHSKSPGDQPRPFFRDAMDAYVDQRYADATDLLEQAARAEPNAADVNFYLGVCRLLKANPADSIAPLQSVVADEKSPWAQAAHFYLAKAYIQTGDLAHAESQLQAAAAMPGRLKAEAGSELTRLQAVRMSKENKKNPEAPKP